MSEIARNIGTAVRDVWKIISDPRNNECRLPLLLIPLAISIILRLPLLLWPEVIYNDSVVYIRAAKGILEGKWSETVVPPLYPALIAAGKALTGEFEAAGIGVSLVLGSLLFIPVYYLGKELYNARVGMVAALLATVQPYFFRYSGAVLTESIYYFLVASIAFLALKAHSTGKPLWIASLALATAMGYLTRPEAIGFILVFMTWVLLVGPTTGRRSVLRRISIVLLTGVCFIAFASPYLMVLRKELGRWELSKKAYVTAGKEDRDATKTGLDRTTWRPKRYTLSSVAEDPLSFMRVVSRGFFVSFYKFQAALNPLLFLLAIWGFTRRRETGYPCKQNFLLLAFVLFFFAIVFPYFKMSARYSSHMIPITLPWAAYGLLDIVERLPSSGPHRWIRGRAAGICLAIIMAGLLFQGVIEGDRGHRVLQREVGLWLKDHGVHGEKVMSAKVHEPFYAEMEAVIYRIDDPECIINIARSKSVRYVVIDEEIEKSHPDFLKRMEGGGLMLLRHWKRGENRIWLFENSGPAASAATQPNSSGGKP